MEAKEKEPDSDFDISLNASEAQEDSDSTEPENSRNTGAEVSKDGEIVFRSMKEYGESTQILSEPEKEREAVVFVD